MSNEQQGSSTLYDKLIEWRDADRKRKQEGLIIIKEKDLPLESNPQGLMRWYMHPAIENLTMNALLVNVQEIPPKGYSGKLKVQGGINIYVWQGTGYTILDGVRYDWTAEDVISIPLRPEGVVTQHFNTGSEETVRLLVVEANLIDALGVDRGAGFEQLQNASTYRK